MKQPMLKCDGCGFLWPLPTDANGIQPGEVHEGCAGNAFRLVNLRPMAAPQLQTAIAEFEAAENLAASLAEQAAEARANAKYIGETVLAALVGPDELNDGVRLPDGTEYVFEQKLKCGVADGMKTQAYEYLEDRKAGGLLRRYLTLSFGKDSAEQVKTFRAMLARVLPSFEIGVKVGKAPEGLRAAVAEIIALAGLNIEVTESVELPGATMAAFVRKEMKAGREVPPAFGVYNPMRPVPAPALSPEEDAQQSAELLAALQASLVVVGEVTMIGGGGGGGVSRPLDPTATSYVSSASGGAGGVSK